MENIPSGEDLIKKVHSGSQGTKVRKQESGAVSELEEDRSEQMEAGSAEKAAGEVLCFQAGAQQAPGRGWAGRRRRALAAPTEAGRWDRALCGEVPRPGPLAALFNFEKGCRGVSTTSSWTADPPLPVPGFRFRLCPRPVVPGM